MSYTLRIPDVLNRLVFPRKMSIADFATLSSENPDLRMERHADGTLLIMSPVSFSSGGHEADFIADLKLYARQFGGEALSSSTGFLLPDGSVRSPDASYVSAEQLASISTADLHRFPAIVPLFVVEVVSPSDQLAELQTKMTDVWLANGGKLAWLVDVAENQLWIYRPEETAQRLSPLNGMLSGEEVLPNFAFDLSLLKSDAH